MSEENHEAPRPSFAAVLNAASAKAQAEWQPPPEPDEGAAVETTGPVTTGAAPETTDAAPDASTTPEGEQAAPADEGPLFTQDAEGKWHRPDGTFATAEEVAQLDAPAETAVPDEQAAEPPSAATIALPAVRDGQQPVEIEIDDPDVADRIRFALNNGMRRDEYNRQKQAFDRKEQEWREFQAILRTAPERVVDRMPPDTRRRTLQYLLANEFDGMRETVAQWYNDPHALRAAQLDLREQHQMTDHELQQVLTAERRAMELMSAARALVPPHATVEDEQDFLRDAEAALAALIQAGQPLTAETVPQHLARHVRRYRFNEATGRVDTPDATAKQSSVSARPIGEKALGLAEAKRVQARIKHRVQTQKVAAATAPAGTGAVPAARPAPPAGNNVEQASQWLRKHGSSIWPTTR